MTPRERIAALLLFLSLCVAMFVQSAAESVRHSDVLEVLYRMEIKNDNYHPEFIREE